MRKSTITGYRKVLNPEKYKRNKQCHLVVIPAQVALPDVSVRAAFVVRLG